MSKSAHVITALQKLLADAPIDHTLRFFHKLHVRFTLTTTDKGMYCCRVYKQYKEDGEAVTWQDYKRGGPSPQGAMRNAIAAFLAGEEGDYHDFINDDWIGKRGHESNND